MGRDESWGSTKRKSKKKRKNGRDCEEALRVTKMTVSRDLRLAACWVRKTISSNISQMRNEPVTISYSSTLLFCLYADRKSTSWDDLSSRYMYSGNTELARASYKERGDQAYIYSIHPFPHNTPRKMNFKNIAQLAVLSWMK